MGRSRCYVEFCGHYKAGLDPAYASLNVDHPEAVSLPGVLVTANAPGVVSESYDPAWASFLASSQGASGFDEAAFRGTGDFAYEQGRLSRNTQAVSDRRAVAAQNYVMQRDAFRPVEATWASKLYDRAVAYGDARTETDRLFHPIEYQLGTRYWMAHALEGAGNVVASFEGLRNKSDGGLFDQGTNPFTQQSRWGVENQDTRLLAVANLATAGVSGLESVAAGAVRSGVETTALGVNGREMVGSVDAWMASREVPATGTLRLPDLADDSLVRVYGGDAVVDVGQGMSLVARLAEPVPGDVLRAGSDIVQSTVTANVGKNTVTWVLDSEGNTLSASGTLRESFSGASRSSAEIQAQADAAASGVAGDQGGHLVAHRFVLDQGSVNLFPQEGNFNMSAFKTLENDYARYTGQGYQVDFLHTLGDFDPLTGRPSSLSVNYEVSDGNGNVLDTFADKFLNQPGQVYVRRAY